MPETTRGTPPRTPRPIMDLAREYGIRHDPTTKNEFKLRMDPGEAARAKANGDWDLLLRNRSWIARELAVERELALAKNAMRTQFDQAVQERRAPAPVRPRAEPPPEGSDFVAGFLQYPVDVFVGPYRRIRANYGPDLESRARAREDVARALADSQEDYARRGPGALAGYTAASMVSPINWLGLRAAPRSLLPSTTRKAGLALSERAPRLARFTPPQIDLLGQWGSRPSEEAIERAVSLARPGGLGKMADAAVQNAAETMLATGDPVSAGMAGVLGGTASAGLTATGAALKGTVGKYTRVQGGLPASQFRELIDQGRKLGIDVYGMDRGGGWKDIGETAAESPFSVGRKNLEQRSREQIPAALRQLADETAGTRVADPDLEVKQSLKRVYREVRTRADELFGRLDEELAKAGQAGPAPVAPGRDPSAAGTRAAVEIAGRWRDWQRPGTARAPAAGLDLTPFTRRARDLQKAYNEAPGMRSLGEPRVKAIVSDAASGRWAPFAEPDDALEALDELASGARGLRPWDYETARDAAAAIRRGGPESRDRLAGLLVDYRSGDTPPLPELENILSDLTGEKRPVTFGGLHHWRSRLLDKAREYEALGMGHEQGVLLELAQAAEDTMDTYAQKVRREAPGLWNAYRDAQDFWRTQVAPLEEDQLLRQVRSGAASTDRIGRNVFGYVSRLSPLDQQVAVVAGLDPKGLNALRFRIIETALERARGTGDTESAQRAATELIRIAQGQRELLERLPGRLQEQAAESGRHVTGEEIGAILARGVPFTAEQLERIEGLGKFLKAIGPQADVLLSPPTGKRAVMPLLVGGLATVAATGRPAAAAGGAIAMDKIDWLMGTKEGAEWLHKLARAGEGTRKFREHAVNLDLLLRSYGLSFRPVRTPVRGAITRSMAHGPYEPSGGHEAHDEDRP